MRTTRRWANSLATVSVELRAARARNGRFIGRLTVTERDVAGPPKATNDHEGAGQRHAQLRVACGLCWRLQVTVMRRSSVRSRGRTLFAALTLSNTQRAYRLGG